MDKFPEGMAVEVRYPVSEQQARGDRESWPWLPGVIEEVCGPDEWSVVVEDRAVAQMEDGSPAPVGTPDDDLYHPVVFRDHTEIREVPE